MQTESTPAPVAEEQKTHASPGQRALRTAVLVPCYNEAATIRRVVEDFRTALPDAEIYVFDNNSSDATIEEAGQAGAIVSSEKRQGKGNVVRRMFADVEADIYVMVDGDATYDAASAPKLVRTLIEQDLDMVVARRESQHEDAYRAGHEWGNRLLTGAVGLIFGQQFTDILSGYRVFSRRFVKSFPSLAEGFETETELTVHALQMRLPISEVTTPYFARPTGSESKLNTWSDGFRILGKILRLFSSERPMQFFSLASLICLLGASLLFFPVLWEYLQTGLVSRIPSLVVAVGGYIVAILLLTIGVIVRMTATARMEAKRFAYLNVPKPPR